MSRLWILLLLVGCSTTTQVLTGKPRDPISPVDVRLYSTFPPGAEEIAVVSATSRHSWAWTDQGQMDAVVEELKKRAAKLGANGLVIQGLGDTSSGGAVVQTSPTMSVYAAARYKAGSAAAVYVPNP